MLVNSITIDNFKRISHAELALAPVTVLIGGNNSGKSSLLQGIHLAITALQPARSVSATANPVSTLGIDQLTFRPANDPMKLHHRTAMSQISGPEFTFTYTDGEAADPQGASKNSDAGLWQ